MRKPFVGVIVALFAILIVGVAVVQGQGASTPTASATPGTCASPVASPMASAVASPSAVTAVGVTAPCASPVADAAAGANISIALEDIRFDPRAITVPANTDVVITITNKGAAVHNFNIDALNVHSGDVQPGSTTTVKINVPVGDYTYHCSIPGHEAAGMVGVLTAQ